MNIDIPTEPSCFNEHNEMQTLFSLVSTFSVKVEPTIKKQIPAVRALKTKAHSRLQPTGPVILETPPNMAEPIHPVRDFPRGSPHAYLLRD